jgi:hypothetical protein
VTFHPTLCPLRRTAIEFLAHGCTRGSGRLKTGVSPSISFRWPFDHRRIPGPPLPVWSGSVGATARNLPRGASSDNYPHVSRDLETASPAQQKKWITARSGVDAAGCILVAGSNVVNAWIVGDQDFRGMTAAGTVWLVFVGEVLAKRALGARAIFWRTAPCRSWHRQRIISHRLLTKLVNLWPASRLDELMPTGLGGRPLTCACGLSSGRQ